MAATDSAGFPVRPAPNELIESAWGGAVRDRLIVKAGGARYDDAGNFVNGVSDLMVVTIPTQAIATLLIVWATWACRAPNGSAGFVSADIFYSATNATGWPVGPWDMASNASIWTGLSQQNTLAVPANVSPSYKLRLNPTATANSTRCVASTNYLLVAT